MADENPPPISPRWPPPENPPPPAWPPPPEQPGMYYSQPSYPPTVNGALILILGILSLVLLPFCFCGVLSLVLGPVAWVMGNNALATIERGQGNPTERPMVVAGRICGIVGTVLAALGILGYGVIMVVAALSPSGHH